MATDLREFVFVAMDLKGWMLYYFWASKAYWINIEFRKRDFLPKCEGQIKLGTFTKRNPGRKYTILV